MTYYDLCICEQDPNATKDMLLFLTKLGYDSVAITHTVDGRLAPKDTNRIPHVNLNEESATTSGWFRVGTDTRKIKQYSRLEVICKTVQDFKMITRTNPVIMSYDIVSVVPMDVSIFNLACNSSDIDVITLTSHCHYVVRPEKVRQAIANGVFIELAYSPLLNEAEERDYFIQYASAIIRSSYGKNIILSSRAKTPRVMRSPYDLCNLGHLFGMTFDQAKAAVTKNPHSAMLHGASRRSHFGMMALKDPALSSELEAWKRDQLVDVKPTNNTVPHPKHNKTSAEQHDGMNIDGGEDSDDDDEPAKTSTSTTTSASSSSGSKTSKGKK
ncbi:hypothetical protein SAMD00019534_019330 [Acytostelium subglobosum LB1]|uniref:hypothetical protein n=1 Tax=Acytostelium subglobosum LB1 TaxID=1410327 RepID=UPI0006449DAB|nr:hypothetical protein SAMD00019534_019330 [Acytostelium subglobosum LB1]GAM18758.1 hypothetical protein SAMD00019534_019330 [Acytostelium subglobosum LB1]|eukprot:XP_012757978.1 hypothetical protein SAMD00019534_019330 [Acytostelium subglobosum LB1]